MVEVGLLLTVAIWFGLRYDKEFVGTVTTTSHQLDF